jgi:hypothetical protein
VATATDYPYSPESLRAHEDDLFDNLPRRYGKIIKDGAGPRYALEPCRTAYILKQPVDPEGAWADEGGDLRDAHTWDFKGRYASTWWRMGGVLAYALDGRTEPPTTAEQLQSIVARGLVVNILKQPGGSRTTRETLLGFLREDAYYRYWLVQQLSFYRPHLTICGGDDVADSIDLLYPASPPWQKHRCASTDEISYKWTPELGLVLCGWHPAYWARDVFPVIREMLDRFARS